MKNSIRNALASAAALAALSGCVVLVPFTNGDGGGGTPSQRGETIAPVDMSSEPSFTTPQSHYENNRAMSRTDTRSNVIYARLIRQLQNGTAAQRTCAATDLGRLRRPQADLIPPLVHALKSDDNKWVRRAAARSLGRLRNPAAAEPLRQALRDRDHWVAHSAANALNQLSSVEETS